MAERGVLHLPASRSAIAARRGGGSSGSRRYDQKAYQLTTCVDTPALNPIIRTQPDGRTLDVLGRRQFHSTPEWQAKRISIQGQARVGLARFAAQTN